MSWRQLLSSGSQTSLQNRAQFRAVCKVGHPQTDASKENDQDGRQSGTREWKTPRVKTGRVR